MNLVDCGTDNMFQPLNWKIFFRSSPEEEDDRRISRSRSRAFSVTRSFDEKKGVWRERKKKLKLSE